MISLYLHIPFCHHRCAYCDFNTYAGQDESIPAYVDALVREIEFVGGALSSRVRTGDESELSPTVHTIFFGGGTPSLLSAAQFEQILGTIGDHFSLSDPEITIEANPGTVSLDYLRKLRSLGINRLSFGVQSAHPAELRMLERSHTYFDVINAVTWARQAGFDNLSLDLIYGLPGQSLRAWVETVQLALGLNPEHLSLYALTMEHGTPFGRWSSRGLMATPNPDAAAEMYKWADAYLGSQGYQQYEISNWARPGRECRHNLQYWRNREYLGLGAGAHGYADGVRYSNVLRIKTYIERLGSQNMARAYPLTPAAVNHHKNSLRENMQETLMTGLRLTREGVAEADFEQRFGISIAEAFPKEVDELLRLGLLEWVVESINAENAAIAEKEKNKNLWAISELRGSNDFRLRLTPQARLLANQAFMRFVGD